MSKLTWYWHRFRAMEPGEVMEHLRKKGRQYADTWRPVGTDRVKLLEARGEFPVLPEPALSPGLVREALQRDVPAILAGQWLAFGRLPLRVDDPPRWQRDYLAGVEVATDRLSFGLDHRRLPHGADIKLVWELSRWHQLGRLAMAAYLLGDHEAGRRCLGWLEDWVQKNPPHHGWNWTSALEAGMRLVQLTWIHAWLDQSPALREARATLRRLASVILASHVRFVWRYRSFGSSANNHLLGELAGLILAAVRWPATQGWSADLETLHALWEQEVLRQFSEDGGNREQALHYHLFSLEFCVQTRAALRAAGRTVSAAVEERLARAADFFVAMQVEGGGWNYGDSDDAFVTWWMLRADAAVEEWRAWLEAPESSPALHYWLGSGLGRSEGSAVETLGDGWRWFAATGQAIRRVDRWVCRWDLSPLGYLSTAAHGHLDALHLSIWHQGVPWVVDPGTGAYYADAPLRRYFTSWEAHNGPHPEGVDFPRRLGPFLWAEPHGIPAVQAGPDGAGMAELMFPTGRVRRTVRRLTAQDGWQVEDAMEPQPDGASGGMKVCWQFAPGTVLEPAGQQTYHLRRGSHQLTLQVEGCGLEAEHDNPREKSPERRAVSPLLRGICAPAFRQLTAGPWLHLRVRGHNPCLLRTTFIACADR